MDTRLVIRLIKNLYIIIIYCIISCFFTWCNYHLVALFCVYTTRLYAQNMLLTKSNLSMFYIVCRCIDFLDKNE